MQKTNFTVDHSKKSPLVDDIRKKLDLYVIGQEKAKDSICDMLALTLIPQVTRGSLGVSFFVGPTGVGKTEIVRALYKILFGADSIGKCHIECNGLKESHELQSLVGSPAGYVDGEALPLLAETNVYKAFNQALENNTLHPILKKFGRFSIVLFDEFEKAHKNLADILYGPFEDGKLELNRGLEPGEDKREYKKGVFIAYPKTTDFSKTLFILTSNLGAKKISEIMSGNTHTMGFTQSTEKNIIPEDLYNKELGKFYKPDFLNRITYKIPFDPLTEKDLLARVNLSISEFNNLVKESGLSLKLTKAAKNYLVKIAYNSNMGARALVREFTNNIVKNFSRITNNGEIERIEEENSIVITSITIDYKDNGNKDEDHYIVSLSEGNKADIKKREVAKKTFKQEKIESFSEKKVPLVKGSLMIALSEQIVPLYAKIRAIKMSKENWFDENQQELDKYIEQFYACGGTSKDIELIENEIMENKLRNFSELYMTMNGVVLWNKKEKLSLFNCNLKVIERFAEKFFQENKDMKEMILNEAGTKSEFVSPIYDFSKRIKGAELDNREEGVIASIFHKNYLKLKGEKQIERKKETTKNLPVKTINKTKTPKKDSSQNITININFSDGYSTTNLKEKLQNLFQNRYDFVIKAVKDNIANKDLSNDIIEILGKTKIQLLNEFNIEDLSSIESMALNDLVKILLVKEEDEI